MAEDTAMLLPESWQNISVKKGSSEERVQIENVGKKRQRRSKHEISAREDTSIVDSVNESKAYLQLEKSNKSPITKEEIQKNILQTRENDYTDILSKTIENSIKNRTDSSMSKIVESVSENMQKIVAMSNYQAILSGVDTKKLTYTNDVRSVSKKYEDMYLRQAISEGERSCVRGSNCECMLIDKTQASFCV